MAATWATSSGRHPGRTRRVRKAQIERPLDDPQRRHLLWCDEGDRCACRGGTSGSTDAVHVRIRGGGYLVVDDVFDAFDVEATGGDVGRDQHLVASAPEPFDGRRPLALRPVRVQRRTTDVARRDALRESVGPMLGSDEHERRPVRAAEEPRQPRRLLVRREDAPDMGNRRRQAAGPSDPDDLGAGPLPA